MVWFGLVVFNVTFNNISVTSWRSVLSWRKRKYPQKTTNLSQVTDKLYVVSSTTLHERGYKLITLVVISTDCTDSCKSNYDHDHAWLPTLVILYTIYCDVWTDCQTDGWTFVISPLQCLGWGMKHFYHLLVLSSRITQIYFWCIQRKVCFFCWPKTKIMLAL